MIHVENQTGNSYPIFKMSNRHLENTIDVFLHKIKAINKTSENNPRYSQDIDNAWTHFAPYFLEAKMRTGIINPIKQQSIENEYFKYRETRQITA